MKGECIEFDTFFKPTDLKRLDPSKDLLHLVEHSSQREHHEKSDGANASLRSLSFGHRDLH
jgi:hypothetical protein